MTLSITTLRIMTFIMNDTQHNIKIATLSMMALRVVMLNVNTLPSMNELWVT
jgi:hypothetical protein